MRAESAVLAAVAEPRETGTGRIAIRLAAGEADIEALLELGKGLFSESVYAGLPYDEGKARKTLRRALARPATHCLLLAESVGDPAGMLYGEIGEHAFSRALGATVHTYYVRPGRRGTSAAIKLLHGFRRWAAERGAVALYVSVSAGIRVRQADRFFGKLGFRVTGGNYALGL